MINEEQIILFKKVKLKSSSANYLIDFTTDASAFLRLQSKPATPETVVYFRINFLSGLIILKAAWHINAASWNPHNIRFNFPG